MMAKTTAAQRLGRVLEKLTHQSGRLTEPPEYGSWLLGRVSESQRRRRIRIQIILTIFIVAANLIGIGVALMLETVALPTPSVFSDAPLWLTFGVVPAYVVMALVIGTYWITRRTVTSLRWAIEERTPSKIDQHDTFAAPWRIATLTLVLWGLATALLTILYGLANTVFIPKMLFSTSFCGVLVATACYLFTEFALRPIAAQALAAGPPPRRFA